MSEDIQVPLTHSHKQIAVTVMSRQEYVGMKHGAVPISTGNPDIVVEKVRGYHLMCVCVF
jgi:hypothetical protein